MDETNSIMQATELESAFEAGFSGDDDYGAAGAENVPEGGGNQTGPEDTKAAPEAQEQNPDSEPATDTKGQEEQLYDLKHLGQTEKVTLAQMTEYAQKGKDYDRIRQRADQLSQQNQSLELFRQQNEETVNLLQSMAQDMGMEVPAFLAALEENMLVSAGMNRDAAKDMVQRRAQNREKAFAEARGQAQAREAQKRRVQEDIRRFQTSFPDASIQTALDIPEVQAQMLKGSTLTEAYGRWQLTQLKAENQRLQLEKQAAEQNTKNKERSVGSVGTDGAGAKDDFMDGFNSVW